MLEIAGLSVGIDTGRGERLLVEEVDLAINAGETLGLVGESGCGKSMTCLAVMGLLPRQARITGGRIRVAGRRLDGLGDRELCGVRGRELAMVFQDPMSSLNPVLRIGAQLAENLRLHQGLDRTAARREAVRLLERVGIPEPAARLRAFPHELSGGMCQRVMIAMAIACRPRLLIADEPTTALDVTIQAQILDLLVELQEETGMALLLVTHDLGVVAETCDRVAVMYAGRVVETAPAEGLFAAPAHPYTAGLLGSLPRADRRAEQLVPIAGQVPEPGARPQGCAYAPRCSHAGRACGERPPSRPVTRDHAASCHRPLLRDPLPAVA
ncbi:ABC transporter ATP-binding protein [Geminicoccaceae bacterium 1502E]|nr:ABC transporter ATP-binding protein [Geminicoccaceae bacterium 1502E]